MVWHYIFGFGGLFLSMFRRINDVAFDSINEKCFDASIWISPCHIFIDDMSDAVHIYYPLSLIYSVFFFLLAYTVKKYQSHKTVLCKVVTLFKDCEYCQETTDRTMSEINIIPRTS
jgi:hypothetical protein